MFFYAKAVLKSTSFAEEAVQEAFRIACSKPESIFCSEQPKGWIMNTLKNVIRSEKRMYANFSKLIIRLIPEEGAVPPGIGFDDYSGVEYSDLLSHEEFRLMRLIVLQNYTIREAAMELGISVEACKKRVQRAKKKLQKALDEMQ